ncbi:MAG: BrxE family protein [Sterolibacteriaceae bacterium]|uniref:BrxE family protein n=1 Tax=Candidatus Methylophosphatis roskildensis TaxID=2899263 RepID=A0A9D7E2S8_9PROT|nr:BrxE family protein [Candidatus Methylophosphatis roskildensis]MBK7235809.1 BrxE family protein [Sterolibacteriaceae bacterium]
MSTAITNIDFDRLLRLRLVVARYGEMDAARWWNTGDAARRTALLGRAGSVLMSRGFPRTHRFAQARLVFEVARARCVEVFDPPGCVTLWILPAALEDQFDARWARWLEERDAWTDFFASIERPASDLLETMKTLDLVGAEDLETVSKLRRLAEGRAVPLPGVHTVSDALITQLAAGFSRGEPGKLAVPYARMDD